MANMHIAMSDSIGVYAYPDTVLLEKFLFVATQKEQVKDYFSDKLDTMYIEVLKGSSLADLLSKSTQLSMRYYGPGQLATAGFRGASSSQTLVIWNGIRINNPMLMQSDMSSIPLSVIDKGYINHGAGTLSLASGAFGGVINLSSKGDARKKYVAEYEQLIGSYGFNALSANINISGKRSSGRTVVYDEYALNNYEYPDNFNYSKPYQLRDRNNASYYRKGFVQKLLIKRRDRDFNFIVWGQSKYTNIPYPIHQPQYTYYQSRSDEDLRVVFNTDINLFGQDVDVYSGYQYGIMNYIETRSRTDAKHITYNFQQGLSTKGEVGEWCWRSVLEYEFQKVNTSEYRRKRERDIGSLYIEFLRDRGDRTIFGLVGRGEITSSNDPVFLPGLIAGIRLGRSKEYVLRLSLMRNRQLPSFNDLYWIPGGNPDLLPEKGYGAELRFDVPSYSIGLLNVKSNFTFWHNKVSNKILWLPDNQALWSAYNIGKVKMTGAEGGLLIYMDLADVVIECSFKHSYILASRLSGNGDGDVKQMIYQPYHSSIAMLKLFSKWSTLLWETSYTGKRFTNSANTSWMPQYSLSNIKMITQNLEMKIMNIRFFCSLNNIFNKHYQTIAWYPMHGRNFKIGLKVFFKEYGAK